MGEVLFRMGTGILGGRNMAEGFSQGGRLVGEYLQQNRQNNQATDQRLMAGYGALSRDKDYANRSRYGTATNIGWRDGSGRWQVRAARQVDGEYQLQNAQGNWVPAREVAGTNDFRAVSRSDDPGTEAGVGGIQNAMDNFPTPHRTRDGREITIDNPQFNIQGSEANARYLQIQNLVRSGVRLQQMEAQGVDPASFAAAVQQAVTRTPQGANVATIAAEFARRSGLTDEDARMYTLSMLRYLNAGARISSGAAITRDEWGRFENAATARYGDTNGVVEELRNVRTSEMRSAASAAGPAARFLHEVVEGKRYMEAPWERRQAPPGSAQPAPQEQPRETTQPALAQGEVGSSQQNPIAVEGPVDVNSMDDNKWYRSRGGTVLQGRQWKQRAGAGR
jgi:hypothetical protein